MRVLMIEHTVTKETCQTQQLCLRFQNNRLDRQNGDNHHTEARELILQPLYSRHATRGPDGLDPCLFQQKNESAVLECPLCIKKGTPYVEKIWSHKFSGGFTPFSHLYH